VTNMTDIINMIYEKYPEPPVSTVLLVFNRALVESAANGTSMRNTAEMNAEVYDLTVHNLHAINEIVKSGMWNGKVKIVEAGSKMVEEVTVNPIYKHYSNIVGGIVNFFLAVQSDIFIGTEVSSYSTLAANSRFFREAHDNYFYRPEGLHWVTPLNATKPHRFMC